MGFLKKLFSLPEVVDPAVYPQVMDVLRSRHGFRPDPEDPESICLDRSSCRVDVGVDAEFDKIMITWLHPDAFVEGLPYEDEVMISWDRFGPDDEWDPFVETDAEIAAERRWRPLVEQLLGEPRARDVEVESTLLGVELEPTPADTPEELANLVVRLVPVGERALDRTRSAR